MQPDLIARIEKAQPSEARELFEEAWRQIRGPKPEIWDVPYEVNTPEYAQWAARNWRMEELLDAQAYLDAAAMFVPEGEGHWPQVSTISTNPNNPSQQKERVEIWMKNGGKPFRGHATTPYFALLAAAMKARQTDERD